jgi:hypothetical protein
MRLFILYPFSGGVRGLHRFLLTRSVVTVLSAMSSLLPGSRFAEGDTVESPHASDQAAHMGALPSAAHATPLDERAILRCREGRTSIADCDARSYAELQRSARGEGRRVELAQLDAPVADFSNDALPFGTP